MGRERADPVASRTPGKPHEGGIRTRAKRNRLATPAPPGRMHPMLDPDTLRAEPGGGYWRFKTTPRLGKSDIAAPSGGDRGPDAATLTPLEAALARIDALYDKALIAAEKGWIAP